MTVSRPTQRRATSSGVRLAELLAALSLGVDLGLGQPMEHLARSCLVAKGLAAHMDVGAAVDRSLYYVTLLGWVGCIADSRDSAAWFGDDITYRAGVYDLDMKPLPFMAYLLRHAGSGGPATQKAKVGAAIVATGARGVQDSLRAHCQVTAGIAHRLGLGHDVEQPLQQIFTRWDGKGLPKGVAGERIALPVRLWHLADVAEVHHRRGGVTAAVDIARRRCGGQFDPTVVRAFGHSRGVAELAAAAGRIAGMDGHDVVTLRRAGLVHDLGRIGVSNAVWDQPTAWTVAEWERARLGPYYTERMLARPKGLAEVGAIAALVHERLDGSGYHRGLPAVAIPAPARVLAAADSYHAMLEERPHRAPLSAQAAARALREDAGRGRLDPDAVDAVLRAAGHARLGRRAGPSGLTAREVEVLTLLARGSSNRQIARRLGITPKTVGNHVEHIYAKAGVTTRAAATLFAMQHGLLGSLEPLG